MSIQGFVAAAGVVVNSSLVLVHSINNRRNQGESIKEAVEFFTFEMSTNYAHFDYDFCWSLAAYAKHQSVQAQFRAHGCIVGFWCIILDRSHPACSPIRVFSS